LAGLPEYQVTNSWPKTCFNNFARWKLLHLHKKLYFPSLWLFNWVTPGQSTTSCLQSFGIFMMMQRSCFKQIINRIIITSGQMAWWSLWFACVLSERVRLKDNNGKICFYPTAR